MDEAATVWEARGCGMRAFGAAGPDEDGIKCVDAHHWFALPAAGSPGGDATAAADAGMAGWPELLPSWANRALAEVSARLSA